MITIMGIDPGAKGAFAILNGDSITAEIMPLLPNGELDVKELIRLISHYSKDVTYAYFEKAQIRQKQMGQFSFIRNFGVIEGILACFGINTIVVPSGTWSKEFDHGVIEKVLAKRKRLIKVARRSIAEKLYPGIDMKRTPACRFSDEGIVDALLIATYGWNKNKNR